ncbi:MAG: ATP-dependent DNA helicase RecG, partial [Holosporales bacterium]|nr:ATP-dependent DNA helicase RecG [Holosporales bacterium]
MGKRIVDALLHMPLHTVEMMYVSVPTREHLGKIITTKVKIECADISKCGSSRPTIVYGKCSGTLIEILLFNYKNGAVYKSFPIGKELFITGKLCESFGVLQFINPKRSLSSEHREGDIHFLNGYSLTSGLSQHVVSSVIKNAICILMVMRLPEWLPQNVIEENSFASFYDSLNMVHFPVSSINCQLENPGNRRLCFDELLAEQIAIKLGNQKSSTGNVIKNDQALIKKLLADLPFTLTESQKTVIKEIFCDLRSGNQMTRLLQGDVGSGKTIVAIITALYLIESGYQCAVLAPTEILARQHYSVITQYSKHLAINIGLLTASENEKSSRETLAMLKDGDIHILVGTHSIISEHVIFKNLGLVIIDEQHRFGVNQRLQLIEKSVSPHILSITATPIPRTIIMSLYGDISVSSIKEKPAGRIGIVTKNVPLSRISDVNAFIAKIISNGEKVYWICPLIEESEKLKYTCVTNRFNNLKEHFGNVVEMLHGKMSTKEKQCIFEEFQSGDCCILVSTTVIEVGVDIANASVIIIENAEKFGLAQLHQLRGRVGRGEAKSYCILLT